MSIDIVDLLQIIHIDKSQTAIMLLHFLKDQLFTLMTHRKTSQIIQAFPCLSLPIQLQLADFISTMFLSHLVIAGTFLTIFITIFAGISSRERRNITSFR